MNLRTLGQAVDACQIFVTSVSTTKKMFYLQMNQMFLSTATFKLLGAELSVPEIWQNVFGIVLFYNLAVSSALRAPSTRTRKQENIFF